MRRNNLFKAGVLTLVLTLAIGMTACGKKNNTVKNTNTTAAQENVTTADKNNTKKTSKVVFDYTDADGNTSKLEGNATVNDNGEATIEVVDSNGNKAVFTGKADTDNGKLSVSDIKVKDSGTLVKNDGTEVKVSEGTKIENATESTEETKADVVAKDNTTEEKKEDVIVADNNVSEDTGNTDTGSDNGNVADTPSNEPVETPDVPSTPSEPEYVPDEPDNGNDTGNDSGNEWVDDNGSGSEDTGNGAEEVSYIPCIDYGFGDDFTNSAKLTWEQLISTKNKYIYYREVSANGVMYGYDYFVFNESIDTVVLLSDTSSNDSEVVDNLVQTYGKYLTWLVY